jgi:hypothetical protein
MDLSLKDLLVAINISNNIDSLKVIRAEFGLFNLYLNLVEIGD